MIKQNYLSVSQFSKITRTTPDTLRYYDRIGLLSPVVRGENKYRYYTIQQLALCNTIRILQKLGVPLSEISELKDRRTPEIMEKMLLRQIEALKERADRLAQAEDLLHTILNSIRSGMGVDTDSIIVKDLPAEPIILGNPNDYGEGRTDYDALLTFYQTTIEEFQASEYDISYPVWGFYSEERVKQGDWHYPDRFYYYNKNGRDQRPAATYAIGHTRAGYGQCAALCARMIEFIDQNGYEICGDAYEEYPLNEVAVADDTSYLMRVMITVRKKTTV